MFRSHPDKIRARDSHVYDEDEGAAPAPALPKRGSKFRGVLSKLFRRQNRPDSTFVSYLSVRSQASFMASEPDLSSYRSVLPDSVSIYESLLDNPRSDKDQTSVKRLALSTYDDNAEPAKRAGARPKTASARPFSDAGTYISINSIKDDYLNERVDDSGDEPWTPPPDYEDLPSPPGTVHFNRAAVPMSVSVHDLRGVARNPWELGHAGEELYFTPRSQVQKKKGRRLFQRPKAKSKPLPRQGSFSSQMAFYVDPASLRPGAVLPPSQVQWNQQRREGQENPVFDDDSSRSGAVFY